MQEAIPVTYYHGVGDHAVPRPKSFLTMPQGLFEQQIHRLFKRGFKFVDLQQVYDYVAGNRILNGSEVVLTFDDGFLDNWTHVFPLAKKLGFKYTIFVNPEFVDPRDIVRPTLEDVWAGKIKMDDLDWWGFLSWEEMRIMEQSGLVDIQSHTMTHTWYPDSPDVTDFHHPGDDYPWMVWNEFPECMPFWLTKFDETQVPYGTPVHRFKRAVAARRYFPDFRVDEHMQQVVLDRNGKDFFDQPDWRKTLQREYQSFIKKYGNSGRFETDAEHEARIYHEVVDSKRIIEEKLSKEVWFVCWPGGAETPLARKIAMDAGYLATTKGIEQNRPGNDPSHIFRVASWFGSYLPTWYKWRLFDGQFDRGRGIHSLNATAVKILVKMRRILTSR